MNQYARLLPSMGQACNKVVIVKAIGHVQPLTKNVQPAGYQDWKGHLVLNLLEIMTDDQPTVKR